MRKGSLEEAEPERLPTRIAVVERPSRHRGRIRRVNHFSETFWIIKILTAMNQRAKFMHSTG
eukprot:7515736-Pyramimonas_sp.AAC.1